MSDTATSQVPKDGFITKQGKTLKPDLVIPTWGMRPNTSYLPSDLLSSTGHVKIIPTFQLPAHPDVFAIGDIVDWNERVNASKVSSRSSRKGQYRYRYPRIERQCEVQRDYRGDNDIQWKTSGMSYLDILWGIMFGGWITSLSSRDLAVSRLSYLTGYNPV
ncbi:hypothetical protein F5890DRAFT_1294827 [Lentinula detonsa]|uniref:FAD/NAD(P)-binding domain-containing protein n=1 Tax=Lentinula detonsa TaxID=2804962 RepID=A0AA38PZF2_9AGAR|nr:hypothetical protein F5890DRAFT_1294827 [Lentinula detonsa]